MNWLDYLAQMYGSHAWFGLGWGASYGRALLSDNIVFNNRLVFCGRLLDQQPAHFRRLSYLGASTSIPMHAFLTEIRLASPSNGTNQCKQMEHIMRCYTHANEKLKNLDLLRRPFHGTIKFPHEHLVWSAGERAFATVPKINQME